MLVCVSVRQQAPMQDGEGERGWEGGGQWREEGGGGGVQRGSQYVLRDNAT